MAVAGVLCIQWGEIAFGSPGPAALKIAALAIGPAAHRRAIVSYLLKSSGAMVGVLPGVRHVLQHVPLPLRVGHEREVDRDLVALVICMLVVPVDRPTWCSRPRRVANDDAFVKARIDMGRTEEFAEVAGRRQRANRRRAAARVLGVEHGARSSRSSAHTKWSGPARWPQAAEMHVKMPKARRPSARRWSIVLQRVRQAEQGRHCEDKGGKWMLPQFLPYPRPADVRLLIAATSASRREQVIRSCAARRRRWLCPRSSRGTSPSPGRRSQ